MNWHFIETLTTAPLAASFSLLSATFVLSLSLFIFLQNRKSALNKLFGLFGATLFFWLFGSFMMFINENNDSSVIFWERFVYVGVVFIPSLVYHLGLALVKRGKNNLLYLSYTLSLVFLILSRTRYFIDGVYPHKWGVHGIAQPAHHLFMLFFFFYTILFLFTLYKHLIGLSDKKERRSFVIILIAFLVLNIIGGLGFLPAYEISVFPISLIVPTFFAVFIGYVISNYEFLEIRMFTTYFLVAVINIIMFNYIFLSGPGREFFVRIIFFVFILLISVFITRSLNRERQIKEQLQELTIELKDLNEHLQEKVDEQTKEIKKAYEVEKRARIKLEDLNKTKSEFVATAAHQLRTPLSATRWALRTLLDGDFGKVELNDAQKELLNKTYTTNNSLIDIVGDLLDVTHIEEGGIKYDLKKSDMVETIEDVVKSVRLLLKDKQIDLSFKNIVANMEPFVFDEQKIAMALKNIIGNAIDYTPSGGKVEVNLKKEGKFAIIETTDTGIGVAQDDMKHIFDKFYRSSNAKKMETDRSGLGLWITKRIIEGHGGTIGIESKEGEGTKVEVRLPVEY